MNRRPADLCRGLLAALEASDGRRRRRKRNTTPDAIGLAIKRELLERAVAEDPAPDVFEAWLLEQSLAAARERSPGGVAAMAREILEEWRLSASVPAFAAWLAADAPSQDREESPDASRA